MNGNARWCTHATPLRRTHNNTHARAQWHVSSSLTGSIIAEQRSHGVPRIYHDIASILPYNDVQWKKNGVCGQADLRDLHWNILSYIKYSYTHTHTHYRQFRDANLHTEHIYWMEEKIQKKPRSTERTCTLFIHRAEGHKKSNFTLHYNTLDNMLQ